MVPGEGIKLIQSDIDDKTVDWDSPLGQAYKLSFEALKTVQAERTIYGFKRWRRLPGETDPQ